MEFIEGHLGLVKYNDGEWYCTRCNKSGEAALGEDPEDFECKYVQETLF